MKGIISGIFYAIVFVIIISACTNLVSSDGYCDEVTQHVSDQAWWEMCND